MAISHTCPACGGRADLVRQRNNFAGPVDEKGGSGLGVADPGQPHVSTTRDYHCDQCRQEWEETLPYADPLPQPPAAAKAS